LNMTGKYSILFSNVLSESSFFRIFFEAKAHNIYMFCALNNTPRETGLLRVSLEEQ